jgi:hypothetical protein
MKIIELNTGIYNGNRLIKWSEEAHYFEITGCEFCLSKVPDSKTRRGVICGCFNGIHVKQTPEEIIKLIGLDKLTNGKTEPLLTHTTQMENDSDSARFKFVYFKEATTKPYSVGDFTRAEVIQKLYIGFLKAKDRGVFTVREMLAGALDELLRYGR